MTVVTTCTQKINFLAIFVKPKFIKLSRELAKLFMDLDFLFPAEASRPAKDFDLLSWPSSDCRRL